MENINKIIEVKNLNYKTIFQDFNLNLEKEKFIALAGANNSGKTTLIKMIGSLISTKKSIYYNDTPIEEINKKELFSEIGVILLEDKIRFIYSSVEEELFNILENLPIEQKEKTKRYQKIIKLLKIENNLTDNPNDLNGINKVKLLLAITLISIPKVILIDNICSITTKKETKEILKILKNLNKKEKITIIMTTNNLDEVIETDYLYILEKGKIAMEGIPLEVLKKDNKLNKLGLSIPFMIDLSVKLNDYDVINAIETDMDRMVDILWK